MSRYILSFLTLFLIYSNAYSKSDTFGPFDLKYRIIKVNGRKANITKSSQIAALSSVSNARFTATGKPGILTLPPGTYKLGGVHDSCKINPVMIDVYTDRRVVLSAICK